MVVSPYSAIITPIVAELQAAFNNLTGRQGDFLSDDVIPGDRFAILKFENLDYDRDRAGQLQRGRAEHMPMILRHLVMLQVAIDCSGLTENQAQQQADTVAIQEALSLHHLMGYLHEFVNPYPIIERFSVKLPIDQGLSQRLKDPSTWVINLTAEFSLHFWIKLDPYGKHL